MSNQNSRKNAVPSTGQDARGQHTLQAHRLKATTARPAQPQFVPIAPYNPVLLSSAHAGSSAQNGYGFAPHSFNASHTQHLNINAHNSLPIRPQQFTYSQATAVTFLDAPMENTTKKASGRVKRVAKRSNAGTGAKVGNGGSEVIPQKKRTLTDSDLYEIIDYWEQNYAAYGRMGVKLFSKRVMDHFNRKWVPQTPDETPVKAEEVEKKLKWMVERYRFVTDKMEASGFGNTEDDPASLQETKERLFKYYHDLHRFLGTKSNNIPALISQFSQRDGATHDHVIRNYGGGRPEGGSPPEVEDVTSTEEVVDDEGDGNDKNKEDGTERQTQENAESRENDNEDANAANNADAADVNAARGGKRAGQGRRKYSVFEEDQDEDEDEIEPSKKKRRLTSREKRRSNSHTPSRSNSVGRGDSRSASRGTQSRLALVEKLATNSSNFTQNAEKSFEKTVEVMMKDVELRSKEVKVMEREAVISQIRAQEHALREQAAMYKEWGEVDEAKKCMREARELTKKLGELNS